LVSLLDLDCAETEIPAVLHAIILLSKGIIRDSALRRKAMLGLIGGAVVMLFLGSLLLSDAWAREHPWLFILYWAACVWLTVAGMLLAVLDVLLIRAEARARKRQIEKEFADEQARGDNR
jgi:F0F1-type ATP synthase assembly protein I